MFLPFGAQLDVTILSLLSENLEDDVFQVLNLIFTLKLQEL